MARKRTTHSISHALVALLGKNKKLRDKLLEVQSKEVWADVAGNPLSLHSHVDKIKKNILVVRCSNSSWMNELSFYKADLIKKINGKLPAKAISDIRFYVGIDHEDGSNEQGV